MNKLLPMTIALLAGSGIGAAPLHAAGAMDAPPCSAAHAADRVGGNGANGANGAMPGTSVRSFSTAGCSGAVLQGDRATATVDGDRIELRDGVVYVNGRSYGAVTPAQTVEYEAARDRRTLKVDGKVRTPQR
ncbi:TPA: sugar ABC transporter ATPase [Burkholderia cenocepacia]|nr:sugar ABC transporter ATPase [Burkholderia cenocepacia]HDR9809173.1 sugar ABC transporter ATPase [Burkholderia cenocepacia]HDR9818843.1 sugar ABC transporter ATPase [Burkholderia cenocepacia]HDR9829112.1 sugar ABC transporter ATPase [Burkholderia cenocepacia]